MEPWMSWAAALGVGAAGYLYYSRPKNQSAARAQSKESKAKDNNQRRQETRDEGTRTDSQKPKKRKQPREEPAAAKTTTVETPSSAAQDLEPEEDDRQWAQQLQAAKQGVSMAANKAANAVGAAKSPKQQDTGKFDGASGSRGPASQDVSDMLEPTPNGPSAIRITGEEKQRKQAPKKEQEPAETKKQRQNRKKNEERKTAREEEERERKKLEESQRRSAREARGEPAKNGLGVAQAPANNAWAGGKSAANGAASSARQPTTTLLDTFDQDAASNTSSNDHTANARSPQNLPSEEEQMQAFREMDEWNEVKGKKGKKKVSAPASPPAEPGMKEVTDVNISRAAELANGSAHKAPAVPNKDAKSANPYEHLNGASKNASAANPRPADSPAPAFKAHPEDSDWAVE